MSALIFGCRGLEFVSQWLDPRVSGFFVRLFGALEELPVSQKQDEVFCYLDVLLLLRVC